MKFEQIEKFEKELWDTKKELAKMEVTDERFGYAVGWLWSEIFKNLVIQQNMEGMIFQHTKSLDSLEKFLLKYYKQANKAFLHDDRIITKLAGYCFMGFAESKGKEVSEEMEHNILQGMSVVRISIKDARKAAGLTQQELSNLLEIPKRTIEAWETGDRRPARYVEKLIIEKLQRDFDNSDKP